jgi:NAD(P)H-dependent glutamate synthase small subunit
MATLRGYIDFRRQDPQLRPVAERIKDFDELAMLPDARELKRQAARCMGCDTPYCHALGCPLASRIPEWIHFALQDDVAAAYASLTRTNLFPEFTGRICPALCESACSLSINMAPVSIRQIEWSLGEQAFDRGLAQMVLPAQRKKQRVAVVGSGPAGLAAAQALNRQGYPVTVFERAEQLGGILRYGIPNFKLPKWVLDRRLDLMRQEGVRFEAGCQIGSDRDAGWLRGEFDALVLCTGAAVPRDLPIPGRSLAGIHFALDYLREAAETQSGRKAESTADARGKQVLVIGGGDTGADCVGTAIRQGARAVTQIEILPQPPLWEKAYNPSWPDYPAIFRTSSSHHEGCRRLFGVLTKSFQGQDSRVAAALCARASWSQDPSGKPSPCEIAGSSFVIPADLVILSMGFLHPEHAGWITDLGVSYQAHGLIQTSSGQATAAAGVFAAGDAATGSSLVCRCIEGGRQAADAAAAWLASLG